MARKQSTSTGPAAKRAFGNSTFTRKSCHTTKTAAKKAADVIRKRGFKARVVGGCVYQGPKAKRKATTK